jgi:hypothetical protein
MLNSYEILKLLLPEFLVEYFDITKTQEIDGVLHISFEEKSNPPVELSDRLLNSKGFLPEITVDDFPIRGKSVKLHIKRRRWLDVKTNETLQRNWELVAKGTRMTQDFAEFLKKISRY